MKEKIYKGEVVHKSAKKFKDAVDKIKSINTSNYQDNIHTILGIILLLLALYALKEVLLGMVLLVFGILFITGYFKD